MSSFDYLIRQKMLKQLKSTWPGKLNQADIQQFESYCKTSNEMTEEELLAPIVVTEDMQKPDPRSMLSDESSWYPHKYKAFDMWVKTEDEWMETLDAYIREGKSTPDFEAEKYIIYQRYRKLLHVLTSYKIKDWVHLVACCIVNANPIIFVSTVLDMYYSQTQQQFSVDPRDNELLWLCLKLRNMETIIVLTKYCYYDRLLYENMFINDTFADMMKQLESLHDVSDPRNKRNLIYLLQNNNVEGALQLIQDGCEVDCWNNYAMKIVVTNEYLKQQNKLTNAILSRGGKIPSYVFEANNRIRNMSRWILQQLGVAASRHSHHHQTSCTPTTTQVVASPLPSLQPLQQPKQENICIFSSDDNWNDDIGPGTFGEISKL